MTNATRSDARKRIEAQQEAEERERIAAQLELIGVPELNRSAVPE